MFTMSHKNGGFLTALALAGLLFTWSPEALAHSSVGFNVFLGSPPPVIVYPAPRVVYTEPVIVEHYPVYRVHHHVVRPSVVVIHPPKHGKKYWKHHGKHHGWRYDD
ncbi:MAG: hypothetical protein ACREP8_07880 [Candidatus Binatia bacterium]